MQPRSGDQSRMLVPHMPASFGTGRKGGAQWRSRKRLTQSQRPQRWRSRTGRGHPAEFQQGQLQDQGRAEPCGNGSIMNQVPQGQPCHPGTIACTTGGCSAYGLGPILPRSACLRLILFCTCPLGRCGRCPPGCGVMSDLVFYFQVARELDTADHCGGTEDPAGHRRVQLRDMA